MQLTLLFLLALVTTGNMHERVTHRPRVLGHKQAFYVNNVVSNSVDLDGFGKVVEQ